MTPINKRALLRDQPELADEVLEIYSMKIFILFDLIFFSFVLGFLLHYSGSGRASFFFPLIFFLFFSILLHFLHPPAKKADID